MIWENENDDRLGTWRNVKNRKIDRLGWPRSRERDCLDLSQAEFDYNGWVKDLRRRSDKNRARLYANNLLSYFPIVLRSVAK